MADFEKSVKITHSLNVLTSFNELKQSNCICNFTIKVGDKSFRVHRDLLGAVSKYFKGMFSSNMVEARNGFVIMKDICADAVGQCVDFMYTGEANPSMESVENTLYASNLMQLEILSGICFNFMKNNLSVQHCFLVVRLARLYNCTELQTISERFIVDNFESLILGENFLHLSKEELVFYLQKLDKKHGVVWHAVRSWISNKDETIGSELMATLHFEEFPYKFLLTDLLNDFLVESSPDAKSFVIKNLLSNIDGLKENLSLDTLFLLRKINRIDNKVCSENVRNIINEFMAQNFEQIVPLDEFVELEKDEIYILFKSPETKYSSEKIKWEAALKWAKQSRRHRKVFPDLFELIKLEDFPGDFIRQTVRNEPLVKDSHKCKDLLLDVFVRAPVTKLVPHIAVSTETDIKTLNLQTNQWSSLHSDYNVGIHLVNVKGQLYASDGNELSLLQDGRWTKKAKIGSKSDGLDKIVYLKGGIYIINLDQHTMRYNIAEDRWDKNLPSCCLDYRFCAAASDEFIYAMGGWSTQKEAKVYDPGTKKWSSLPQMIYGTADGAAVVFQSMVYVLGGWNGERSHNLVQCYNPVVRSWAQIASMKMNRSWLSACVADNKMYAIGGARCENQTEDSIETFNEETGEWEIVCEMNWPGVDWVHCCSFAR
ncbi:kelch-like protein 23 [Styela clava]|uniref:kelch-like protein 18 n=1 Tax=Styela clava TaxID=7725 RepID=UPI00193A9CDB|nr:kelch-like protein 18 [Styela clava]